MSQILVIDSSASGSSSVSKLLVADTVKCLIDVQPRATVTYRDVGSEHVPHLSADTVAGVRAVAETASELATRDLSDQLIAELQIADVLVIGAPMYNFSIPSTLRTWFDHVLRPRVTFAYGADGPEGLLRGKRAIVIEARGGLYSEGPSKAIDFQEPYLKQLLGFIGITDVTFIRAEKLGLGAEARAQAIAAAKTQIAAAAASFSGDLANLSPAARTENDAALPARPSEAPIDVDTLLQANLKQVFGERNPQRRLAVIRTLYQEDAELHEPGRMVRGHEAISHAVTELLASLPPNFTFQSVRPALGLANIGRLQWRAGPQDGPAAVTGTDVAQFEDGRIQSLYVFLDQKGA